MVGNVALQKRSVRVFLKLSRKIFKDKAFFPALTNPET